MKTRLKKELKKIFIVVALGAIYFCAVKFFKLSLPCPFYKITGYMCPGCGITRMLLCVAVGNFKEAIKYNPLLFFTLPLIVLFLSLETIRRIKNERYTLMPVTRIFLFVEITSLVIFGILRNTSFF